MPAGEILRFDRVVVGLVWMLFCFAQRARWAAAIRRRAEADIVCFGDTLEALPLGEVRVRIAWSIRVRSCCSSLMIPSMFGMAEILSLQNAKVEGDKRRSRLSSRTCDSNSSAALKESICGRRLCYPSLKL